VAGGDWPKRVEDCAKAIVNDVETGVPSIRIEILSRLRPFFRTKWPTLPEDFKFLPTTEILKHLNSDDEAPWADDKAKSGKEGLTAERLRYHLKEYQIKSQKKQRGGVEARGYWLLAFKNAFDTYLPPEEPLPTDDGPGDDDSGGSGGSHPSKPTPDGGETQADPEGQETPSNAGKGAENIIEAGGPPISGSQPVDEVVSPSGSTIQAGQVDLFNSSLRGAEGTGKKRNPSCLDYSAATTYENVDELKGVFGGTPACTVFSDPSALDLFIRNLPSDLSRVGLDIETYVPGKEARGRKPKKDESRLGTALDWQVARIRLLSLAVPGQGSVVIDLGSDNEASAELRLAVAVLLERLRSVELIGHNLRFDLSFLAYEFGWRPLRVWDTWIAAELLLNDDWELVDEDLRPKKVKPGPTALVSILKADLGIEIDKMLGGGAYSDFGTVTLTQEQYTYSALDVTHLFAEADFQRAQIEQAGLTTIANIEMQLVPIMAHMEIVGIPMRAELLDEALAKFHAEQATIEAQILPAMQVAGFDPYLDYSTISKTYLQPPDPSKQPKPVNINGSNLRQHYFHAMEKRLGLKLPRTEKSQKKQWLIANTDLDAPFTIDQDRISLTQDVLRPIDDTVAKLYAEWMELSSLIIGVEQRRKYIGSDGRVHPIHDQMSANTGRISTSEPAMSNLPRSKKGNPLRRAVEDSTGYALSQADLGQIELRAQAHHTGEPTLVRLFNLPPEDPQSDIYRLFASWLTSKLTGTEVKVEDIPAKGDQRDQAKPVVLGSAYLMGVNRFLQYAHDSYGVDFSRQQAKQARELYFKKFPGIKAWHEEAWANANADRVTEGRTHLGRRRLVLKVPGDSKYRYRQAQAQVNFVIQAGCADGLKLAIILIVRALPPDAELILTVHDELLILCRADQAEAVKRIVEKAVVAAYKVALGEPLKVPIVIRPVTIQNWSHK
jgi:DNA polymerase-1